MRRDFHDEVGIESSGDPFEQGDGGDDATGLEPGLCGLRHPSPGGEFRLGHPEGQAALTDRPPDEDAAAIEDFLGILPDREAREKVTHANAEALYRLDEPSSSG